MSTKVIKEGNVTTTIKDLTNGVGGRSAEVGRDILGSRYKEMTSDPGDKMYSSLHFGSVNVVSLGWNLKRLKFPD